MAEGNFTGPWSYTVGLSLFYLPFQLVLQAETLQEFYPPFLLFNCFIVTPFALCMGYRAVKKLSSAAPAFSTVLLWFGMTLFQHHRYFEGSDGLYSQYIYRAFPALPEPGFFYSLYELYTFYGYNCVSDTVSMALVFACIASALCMKVRLRNLALFAALFGLACLVRINNILFAPLLLLILYLRYAVQLDSARNLLRFLAVGTLAFLAVFSIQLVIDWIQFGNPFTLPYALHGEGTRKGFSFAVVDEIHRIPFILQVDDPITACELSFEHHRKFPLRQLPAHQRPAEFVAGVVDLHRRFIFLNHGKLLPRDRLWGTLQRKSGETNQQLLILLRERPVGFSIHLHRRSAAGRRQQKQQQGQRGCRAPHLTSPRRSSGPASV